MLILKIFNDLFTAISLQFGIDFDVDLQVKRGGGYAACCALDTKNRKTSIFDGLKGQGGAGTSPIDGE